MSTRQPAARAAGATAPPFPSCAPDACNAVAMELLRNPALTIGDVALAVGYSDTPNFRRAFRQWQGVTPSEFRASLGPAAPQGLVPAKRGGKRPKSLTCFCSPASYFFIVNPAPAFADVPADRPKSQTSNNNVAVGTVPDAALEDHADSLRAWWASPSLYGYRWHRHW